MAALGPEPAQFPWLTANCRADRATSPASVFFRAPRAPGFSGASPALERFSAARGVVVGWDRRPGCPLLVLDRRDGRPTSADAPTRKLLQADGSPRKGWNRRATLQAKGFRAAGSTRQGEPSVSS